MWQVTTLKDKKAVLHLRAPRSHKTKANGAIIALRRKRRACKVLFRSRERLTTTANTDLSLFFLLCEQKLVTFPMPFRESAVKPELQTKTNFRTCNSQHYARKVAGLAGTRKQTSRGTENGVHHEDLAGAQLPHPALPQELTASFHSRPQNSAPKPEAKRVPRA